MTVILEDPLQPKLVFLELILISNTNMQTKAFFTELLEYNTHYNQGIISILAASSGKVSYDRLYFL